MWYENFISFVFFTLSVILVVVAVIFVIGSFFSLLSKAKQEVARLAEGKLEIKKLGDDYKETKSSNNFLYFSEVKKIRLNKK